MSNGLCNEALCGMFSKPTGECNFVFIATSYNGASGDMTWLVGDIYNAHPMGWKNFRLLDIAIKSLEVISEGRWALISREL